jgi:hypothetical protein
MARHDAAQAQYRAARRIVDRTRFSVTDPGLIAALDRSAALRAIIELTNR